MVYFHTIFSVFVLHQATSTLCCKILVLIYLRYEVTMSSSKALLCKLCIMLAIGFTVVLADDKPTVVSTGEKTASSTGDDLSRGNCSCGGFPAIAIETDSQPLLSQSPGLEVKCDDEGESTCKQLCIALATAAKAKGPEVLCIRLKNALELKLSAFSKICDRPWMYADMTAEEPLCCVDSKVKLCPSTEKANSTVVIDAKSAL